MKLTTIASQQTYTWRRRNSQEAVLLTDDSSAVVRETFAQLDKGDGEGLPGYLARHSAEGIEIGLGHLIVVVGGVCILERGDIDGATTKAFLQCSTRQGGVGHLGLRNDGSLVSCDCAHVDEVESDGLKQRQILAGVASRRKIDDLIIPSTQEPGSPTPSAHHFKRVW